MASVTGKWQFKALVFTLTMVFGFLTSLRVLFWMLTHPLSWFKQKDRSITPACLLDPSLGSHEYMTANGIKFHYVVKGDRTKPLMLLLHGFPEFWFSWRHQLRAFSSDYRVIAVDMRGYGDTTRPPNKTDYVFDKLRQDVVQLISQFGYAKCTLVAHDWGGVIAWRVVQKHPELVDNFIVMNCPHPKVYSNALAKNKRQILKSWYIFMFQLPIIPELAISMYDYQSFVSMFTKPPSGAISKDSFPPEVLEAYKYTFSKPGALTGPINYYRCMLNNKATDQKKAADQKKAEGDSPPAKISVPTLLIWGDSDMALDVSMADEHTLVAENITIKYVN